MIVDMFPWKKKLIHLRDSLVPYLEVLNLEKSYLVFHTLRTVFKSTVLRRATILGNTVLRITKFRSTNTSSIVPGSAQHWSTIPENYTPARASPANDTPASATPASATPASATLASATPILVILLVNLFLNHALSQIIFHCFAFIITLL